MKTKILLTPVAAALTVILAGCMVGPDYHRPQVTMPAHFSELDGWTTVSPQAADVPKGDWWAVFNDPLMNQLEPLVEVSNQTVRQNYAQYRQALAEVKVADAALFPTLGITGDASRSRGSSSTRVLSSGSLEGNASWEIDVWGQIRRNIEESKATAQESAATLANATLSAQLALAQAIINLRASDANMDLLDSTIKEYEEYLRVIANQDRAGTVPPSNLLSARTQLENARSSRLQLGIARAQYAHSIAVLVGRNPEDLQLPHDASLPEQPPLPVALPSTLLERRSDIAAAERKMAAQNAAIGVAVAGYFPTISLSAMGGFLESPLSGLFKAANRVWSLGANASATLFNGGQTHAEVLSAEAAYDAAVASYRGTVLTALQDVEDELAALHILEQQTTVLAQSVKDSQQAAKIAFNEYQAGTVDYTTVATARATQLSTEQSALSVRTQRLLDAAALIGDLGGGWSADQLAKTTTLPPEPVAEPAKAN